MKAYVLVKIQAGESPEVIANIRSLKGIARANLTFGPYDALAVVQAPSIRDIGRLVHFELLSIPGVLETTTCIAIDEDPSEILGAPDN